MAQGKRSGQEANRYGRTMARKVAQHLGTRLISSASNEAMYDGKRIVIKSAHYKTGEIGVSKNTLSRADAIIAALETQKGDYALYEITPQWYNHRMRLSRSSSPSAPKIMMVSCKAIIDECQFLTNMPRPANPKEGHVPTGVNDETNTIVIDSKIIDKVNKAISASLDYEAATNGKRKLGITAEIGEVLACHKLGLRLSVNARSEGFDAIDKDGLLVQIKSRRSESKGLPRDMGRIGSFSKHPFDYALLVLLDNNYRLCEIWRAEYKKLKPIIDKQKRRNPNLASFKRVAKKILM